MGAEAMGVEAVGVEGMGIEAMSVEATVEAASMDPGVSEAVALGMTPLDVEGIEGFIVPFEPPDPEPVISPVAPAALMRD